MAKSRTSNSHPALPTGDRQPAGAKPNDAAAACKPSDATDLTGLLVVATPIGNLSDITLRALRVLAGVDLVLCEDTHLTGNLLKRHGIQARLFSYHEHNAKSVRPTLMKRLKHGESMALVSDAGTPLISDPGYRLVEAARQEGVPVTALPGPSSAINALVLSGLPADRFLFQGFLPNKSRARRKVLAELQGVPATLVFLESAKRLAGSLRDMAAVLGDRDGAVVREMTKVFEETRPGSLTALADLYAGEGPPKGEVVVVVAPPPEVAMIDDGELESRLREALASLSVKDAAQLIAGETGQPRKTVYQRALAIKKRGA